MLFFFLNARIIKAFALSTLFHKYRAPSENSPDYGVYTLTDSDLISHALRTFGGGVFYDAERLMVMLAI